MQSTNMRQIKAAIRDQAFIGCTWVSCSLGRVVAIRKRKGRILVMVLGWPRWYEVPSVRIEWSRTVLNAARTEANVSVFAR
jgi:hypothetical protein